MSWLRRSADRAEAVTPPVAPVAPAVRTPRVAPLGSPGPRPPDGPAAQLGREEHAAPGLRHALEQLPRPGASVLDLGPALAANVAFFEALGARLRIADLDASLEEVELLAAPPATWAARLPELLPFAEGETFDLVLAWDLPNYLGRERWPAVARHIIARLARSGAFHLLVRVGADMPARPCRYRILERGTISEEPLTATRIPAPRTPHAEVEKLHPGLVAPRSHLGKHGVQEYVLEPAAIYDMPPRPIAQPRKRPR
jgi:hypothetical protein